MKKIIIMLFSIFLGIAIGKEVILGQLGNAADGIGRQATTSINQIKTRSITSNKVETPTKPE